MNVVAQQIRVTKKYPTHSLSPDQVAYVEALLRLRTKGTPPKAPAPAPTRGTPRRFDPKAPVFLSLDEVAADAFAYGIGTGQRNWAKSLVQTGRLACTPGRPRRVRSDVWAAWIKDRLDAARPR